MEIKKPLTGIFHRPTSRRLEATQPKDKTVPKDDGVGGTGVRDAKAAVDGVER